MGYLKGEKAGTTDNIDEEHLGKLMEMKLHGNYFKSMADLPNIDEERSRRWLNTPTLRFETESLLYAAQEQTLATKHLKSKIWGSGPDRKCRLCKEEDETVHHIVSGCRTLCGTQCLDRHNHICKYIH